MRALGLLAARRFLPIPILGRGIWQWAQYFFCNKRFSFSFFS